jgi:GntR family transcriptional regulator/MocR family aminotransferase
MPTQAAVTGFIEGGHLTRHIGKMRRLYGERRSLVLDLLREDFEEWLEPVESAYGMHVTAISNGVVDVDALSRELVRRNVHVRSLSRYYLGAARQAGLVFGFGMIDPPAIRTAMEMIREAMAEG